VLGPHNQQNLALLSKWALGGTHADILRCMRSYAILLIDSLIMKLQ